MTASDLLSNAVSTAGPFAIVSLSVIGLFSLSSFLYSYVSALLSLFVLSGINLRKYGPPGSWVVITGASDGIGKEFALQLARKGYNLFLISRTASKLTSLASELSTVKTKTYAMDFARDDSADYDNLKRELQGLDVAILINNVGRSHDIPVSFLDTPASEMEDIITINCKGTLKITAAVAPGMCERRRGLILTMGSFAGLTPTPLLATYSGSKAFLQHWSTALGAELKPFGVDTQLVVGYLITSAMSKIRRPSAMIPTPRGFVKACLGKIGLSGTAAGRIGTITPWWSHGLMHWGAEKVLGVYNGFLLGKNLDMHVDIRKRALRKREREAKKE